MSMRTIGPYQPLEQLTEAARFTIYRAIDPRLFGQPVSLIVSPFRSDPPGFAQLFEQGATTLTTLRHPNILPLNDFGETLEYFYLVTPYLEAPTLAAAIGQPRRPVEALGLIATLGEAIDYAHRLGQPHGRLTPDAIQLTNLPPGEDTLFAAWPIIRYYGFASLLTIPPEADSPYQQPAREEAAASPESDDRYALAAILYALLTGTPPDAEQTLPGLATLAEELASPLRRALSPDPANHYGTAAEFILALREGSAAARQNEEKHAAQLLDEAREAVAGGKLRAASEAYSAYLLLRPGDDLAKREFATIESRRAELARRRAEAVAATAVAQPPPAEPPPAPAPTPATPTEESPEEEGWSVSSTTLMPPAPDNQLRQLFPFGSGQQDSTGGIPPNMVGVGATRQAAKGTTPRDFKPIAAPARLRRQAVLPTAIAAAVLLLVLALASLLIARQRQQGTNPPGTPLGTTIAIAGSRTPGSSPTPSRIAPNVPPVIPIVPPIAPLTPTPVPTLPPLEPVINDTFGDPNTGFPREPGGLVDAGYHNGEYILKVQQPDEFEIAELTGCKVPAVPDCNFGDLIIEVDMKVVGPASGGSYGVVFRRQFAGAYVQYFVLVDPEQGTVRLVRWNDTDRIELIPPTPLLQIAKGEANNHLVIAMKGRTITVGVNGANLPTVTDPDGPLFGLVALRADAGAAPIEVHFDNFIIRPIR